MRVMLAALDHNFHLFCKAKSKADGGQCGHRKYSKHSQKYHAELVKEENTYSYFPFLIAKMLWIRTQMEGTFSLPSDRNEFDPKQIATTIGMKEPPPIEELLKGPLHFIGKQKCKLPVHPLVQSRPLVLEKLVPMGIAPHKWHQI